MLHLGIEEAAKAMKASLSVLGGSDPVRIFPSVSIDSRTISAGEAFFAIKGPNLDGHQFLNHAIEKGAAILVISDRVEVGETPKGLIIVKVADTTLALQQLSNFVRNRWAGKIVAITGSMGKTTTRSFTTKLLSKSFCVHETRGNFNNEYGLPLSLLSLKPEHDLAVLELGMSHSGEIRLLSEICCPNIGLITNIAPVHLEFFSDLNEIAEAKAELLQFIPEDGHFFFNGDDFHLQRVSERFGGNQTSFGFGEDNKVKIQEARIMGIQDMLLKVKGIRSNYSGTTAYIGKPAAYNIAAAVAVAEYYGIHPDAIIDGLKDLRPPTMRGEITKLNQITLWNDTYNANPKAVEALLDTIRQISSYTRKVAVLGDMLELGSESKRFHQKVGQRAADSGLNLLVTIGEASKAICESAVFSGFPEKAAIWFSSAEDAASFLADYLKPGDLVAIKGSRGLKLEKIVTFLQETAA